MDRRAVYVGSLGLCVLGIGLWFAWRGWLRWQPVSIDDPETRALIARVERAYATCSSYSDQGQVSILGESISFRTLYKAPGKLYFEFTDPNPKNPAFGALWCDGTRKPMRFGGVDTPVRMKETYVATEDLSFDKTRTGEQALRRIIAGFTGISIGSAHTIPTLLFPKDLGGLKPSNMADLRVLGSEIVDGHNCYVLASKEWETTLSIDKSSCLIRKVVDTVGGTESVTTYHPIFGTQLDDSVFVRK